MRSTKNFHKPSYGKQTPSGSQRWNRKMADRKIWVLSCQKKISTHWPPCSIRYSPWCITYLKFNINWYSKFTNNHVLKILVMEVTSIYTKFLPHFDLAFILECGYLLLTVTNSTLHDKNLEKSQYNKYNSHQATHKSSINFLSQTFHSTT